MRSRSPDEVSNAVSGRSLEKEIEEIETLSLDDLRIRWRNLSGRLATAHLSRALLARILAYRLQAHAFGDLDRNTARALARWSDPSAHRQLRGEAAPNESGEFLDGPSAPQRRASAPLILKPGTLLTREWQGRMETVTVVADGFAWNGEIIPSLSAVAQAITGTKWNGHRFFGVRPQDRSGRGSDCVDDPRVRLESDGKVQASEPSSFRKWLSKASRARPGASGAGQ
jgi:Protein of unknown function (DUF2924)